MFTGIIKKTAVIKKIVKSPNGINIALKTKLNLNNKDIGTSVNCSGACLTLEKIC